MINWALWPPKKKRSYGKRESFKWYSKHNRKERQEVIRNLFTRNRRRIECVLAYRWWPPMPEWIQHVPVLKYLTIHVSVLLMLTVTMAAPNDHTFRVSQKTKKQTKRKPKISCWCWKKNVDPDVALSVNRARKLKSSYQEER